MSAQNPNTGSQIIIGQKAISVKVVDKPSPPVCLGVMTPDSDTLDSQGRTFAANARILNGSEKIA